jgi:excisionase family DNA binding protein
MDQKLLYTISEGCQLLSVGRTKLYELIGAGELPVRKLGKKTLISAADLRACRSPSCDRSKACRSWEVKAARNEAPR